MKNQKLAEIIKGSAKSIPEIAKETGVSKQTVYNYVDGNTEPHLSTAFKLADILQVDINSFREPNQ